MPAVEVGLRPPRSRAGRPLIYLAAEDRSGRGDIADDPLRKAFVQRWSPCIWESVTASHWMDEADPKLVEKNLERVIGLADPGH